MTTLLHERGTLGFALAATLDVAVRKLIALAKERNVTDPVLLDRIAREWVELQALKYTNYRSLTTLHEDRHPGPGGLGLEARLVGGEPAADEARAGDPRLARAADRRRRLPGRLLAVPAAPLARQHDRGRHERDPPQHRRRARARPAEEPLMDFSFSAEQDDLRREARAFLEANPSPSMEQLAELGWVGILQSEDFTFLDAAVLFEELGRVLYDGPFVLNEVAAQPGDEVWSIEIDGFVPHLAQVGRVLTPGHAGRDGAGRGGRDRRRDARPRASCRRTAPSRRPATGPTCGGGCSPRSRSRRSGSARRRSSSRSPTSASASSSARRSARTRRSRTRSSTATSRSSSARSLAYWAAWCVAEGDEQADLAVAAAKSQATEAAVLACEKSIQAHGGIGFTWEHPLHRYYKRALWLEGALGYGREQRARDRANPFCPRNRRVDGHRRARRPSCCATAAGTSTRRCGRPGEAPAGTRELVFDVTDAGGGRAGGRRDRGARRARRQRRHRDRRRRSSSCRPTS